MHFADQLVNCCKVCTLVHLLEFYHSLLLAHLHLLMAAASGRLLWCNVRQPNSVLVQLYPGARQSNPIIVRRYTDIRNEQIFFQNAFKS